MHEARLLADGGRITDRQFVAALALREAAADVLAAVADGRPLPATQVERLNAEARTLPVALLDATTGGPVAQKADVRAAMARIAADAIALALDRRERLVRCSLDECRALLLSGTVGERRRWCSMERCGNLAKVRAYRRRRQSAAANEGR